MEVMPANTQAPPLTSIAHRCQIGPIVTGRAIRTVYRSAQQTVYRSAVLRSVYRAGSPFRSLPGLIPLKSSLSRAHRGAIVNHQGVAKSSFNGDVVRPISFPAFYFDCFEIFSVSLGSFNELVELHRLACALTEFSLRVYPARR